jgi:hypothetical protein
MGTTQTSTDGFKVNTSLLAAGAALVGLGGLLATIGLAVGGTAVLTAVRRRVRQMDVSPSELARRNVARAKAAAAASSVAWRGQQVPAQRAPAGDLTPTP